MQTASIEAHAKLTVHLHVIGVRDDGMHLIDAEMVSLNFYDTLVFSEGDELIIHNSDLPVDESNLITRALRLAGATARVEVTKRIPIGGGLGGGSANAAAVLRWANFDDLAAAATLGADIPFCMVGGRARVAGIGEIVKPQPFEARQFTLLLPPFGVNTAAVYQAYDEMAARIDSSDRNHLEAPALAVEPRLERWRRKFAEWTGSQPVLAGSGSTWFVEGSHKKPSADELGNAQWIQASTVPAPKSDL